MHGLSRNPRNAARPAVVRVSPVPGHIQAASLCSADPRALWPRSGVFGSEFDGTRADKRELVAYILEKESLEPQASVMVGDRAHDIRAARANGLSSVGVLWGYGSREELAGAGATSIIDHPDALLGKIGI